VTELLRQMRATPNFSFRVVDYYCSANETRSQVGGGPNPEQILRSLCRKLSWAEDDTISHHALEFHATWQAKQRTSPSDAPLLGDWIELLQSLLEASCREVVIAIDALDECSDPEQLLETLHNVVVRSPKLRIVCSSRDNVQVDDYFRTSSRDKDTVKDVDCSLGLSSTDMQVYVDHALKEKMQLHAAQRSIFGKCDWWDYVHHTHFHSL
jgi:hypothetical protein